MPRFFRQGWVMDEIDKFILEKLMNNAKIKLKELCEITGLTKVPMSYRVNKLTDDFIIGTYSRVDKKKLGYNVESIFIISLQNQSKELYDDFICYISNKKEIRCADLVTGTYDFVLRVVAKNAIHMNEINLFLRECPYIFKCQMFDILSTPLYREGVPL